MICVQFSELEPLQNEFLALLIAGNFGYDIVDAQYQYNALANSLLIITITISSNVIGA